MIVLHVTSTEFNERTGKRIWMLFEVEAENMKAVIDRLNNGEIIHGFSLWATRDPQDSGTYVVTEARETTLVWDEVHRIQAPTWKLVRYDDSSEASTEA